MQTDTQGALPEALLAVRTRPLFTLWLDVRLMLRLVKHRLLTAVLA